MDEYLSLENILKFGVLFLIIKIGIWLSQYFYKVYKYRSLPGLPIIPFIGNVHQFVKPKNLVSKLHPSQYFIKLK